MRSFIAVKISFDQKEQISELIRDFKRTDVQVKWVNPENLHVTLKFLGEVDERALPNIFDALQKSLTNDRSFQFNLESVGCFPNMKRPRVIWVGIDHGADKLNMLAKKVDGIMTEFSFEREKRGFSAHLTIGRVKDSRGMEELTSQFKQIKFQTGSCVIDEVIFFQSILKREGPTYIPHKRFKLQTMDKEG
jgi:RNA 2',3'-cyclic 3'-phosphodiesterase